MKLPRPSFTYLRRHKRWVVITLGFIIVALGLVYGLWSNQQWKQYQPAYTAQRATIQASLDGLRTHAVVTPKDKTVIKKGLTEASRAIDAFEPTACQVNGLVAWQGSIIKSLQEERDQCRAQAAKMADLNTELRDVVAFLEDDQAVTEQLSKASQADELADTAWQVQVTTWQLMSQTLGERSTSLNYRSVQQLIVQKTKAIASAWEAIIAAHTAKDKQKYISAQNDLAGAYDGLDEISIETTEVITELAKAVDEKYQAAF